MSDENVESFRRAIDAFNDRSVEGMMAVCAVDVEFRPLLAGVTNTPYRGEEGVRKFLAATDEAFEVFRLDCQRVEDHGDYVVALNEGHARGRASGAETHQPLVQIARYENGKIVWWQTFRTSEEALAAAGLAQ
jgi:ketosteroid isomerase-like protein